MTDFSAIGKPELINYLVQAEHDRDRLRAIVDDLMLQHGRILHEHTAVTAELRAEYSRAEQQRYDAGFQDGLEAGRAESGEPVPVMGLSLAHVDQQLRSRAEQARAAQFCDCDHAFVNHDQGAEQCLIGSCRCVAAR